MLHTTAYSIFSGLKVYTLPTTDSKQAMLRKEDTRLLKKIFEIEDESAFRIA